MSYKYDERRKRGLSPAAIFTLISAAVIVIIVPSAIYFYSARQDAKQQKIIHFLIDDYSESAQRGKIDLSEEHCKVSSQLYLQGDTRIKIAFANRAEVVSEKVLENNLAPGLPLINCKKEFTPSSKVGDAQGTSLTDVMEYVQTLVRNVRVRGAQQPIIITITIQDAESDLEGQSPETERRFRNLRRIVSQITTNDNVIIQIIGPIGALQEGLNRYLGDLSGFQVCSKNNVQSCVTEAFSVARNNQN